MGVVLPRLRGNATVVRQNAGSDRLLPGSRDGGGGRLLMIGVDVAVVGWCLVCVDLARAVRRDIHVLSKRFPLLRSPVRHSASSTALAEEILKKATFFNGYRKLLPYPISANAGLRHLVTVLNSFD